MSYGRVIEKSKKNLEFLKQSPSTQYFCHPRFIGDIRLFLQDILLVTFGILDWTKQDFENVDIKARKILSARASFHISSDVDRLYCYLKNGGRGLNSIVDTFISNIVSLSLHLRNPCYDNQFLNHLFTHETERLIRVAENLLNNFSVEFQEGIQEVESSTKVVNML